MNKGRRTISLTICLVVACAAALVLRIPGGPARPSRPGDDAFNFGVDRGVIDTQMGQYDVAEFEIDRPTGMLTLSIAYSPDNHLFDQFRKILHIPRKPSPLGLKPGYTQDPRGPEFVRRLLALPESEQATQWQRFVEGYKASRDWAEQKGIEPKP